MNTDPYICEQEVELGGQTFVVYFKRVPTRLGPGGHPLKTTVRAFVKKKDKPKG